MESLTKNKLEAEVIKKLVETNFGKDSLKEYHELTEGFFNVAYEIVLQNNNAYILKVAPKKDVRIMTYEKNIMLTEVESMKMASEKGNIPVPGVIAFDDSCKLCPTPYFFMEKLEGTSLNSVKEKLKEETIAEIYKQAGAINKNINDIICPIFGYPGQPEFQGEDWYEVFHKMLLAGIEDARNGDVDLKIDLNELWTVFKQDKNIFNEVTEPRLVHWDCWDGNIFVKDEKITGFIDWERSLWADPLMEVGFRTYSDHKYFQEGYGKNILSKQEYRRALWYDVYLLILVSLECEYRQYETMDMYHWSTDLLKKQFLKLLNK